MEVDNLIVANKTNFINFIDPPPDIILLDHERILTGGVTTKNFYETIPLNYNYIIFNLYWENNFAFNMKIKLTDFYPANFVAYAETWYTSYSSRDMEITPVGSYVISITPESDNSRSAISCWVGNQMVSTWYISAIATVI